MLKEMIRRLKMSLFNKPYIRKYILAKKSKSGYNDYHLIKLSGLFDDNYYLKTYRDIAACKVNPLSHFVEFGHIENRNPNNWFNVKFYKEVNKHHLNKKQNPLVHYIIDGKTLNLPSSGSYASWISMYDNLTSSYIEGARSALSKHKWSPKISVILPVYDPSPQYLVKAIQSVLDQLYENWELCIADDCSPNHQIREIIREYAAQDKRIKYQFRKENGHISEASNTALELATGEYIGLLDHDDELRPHSLYEAAKVILSNRQLKLIYSDEDKIDENGRRFDPYFKSDWNKDLLYGQNYVSHLGIYKTSLVRQIGGFRKGYEGSQDHDLLLRYIERINDHEIYHIPKILYHWRAVKGSTSLNIGEKNYAVVAGVKALNDHFERTNQNAHAEVIYNSQYRIKRKLSDKPLVSFIVPFKDKVELLIQCVDSLINRTSYKNTELLLVNNNSQEKKTLDYLRSIEEHSKIKIVKYDKPFNYSAINNFAVTYANGDILGLVNNDINVINEDWLNEMVSHILRNEVGVVGAKLLYDDDTIQHAGVILGIGGVAGHIHKNISKNDYGYFTRAALTQSLSAVTGACLLTKKDLFLNVGGLDEKNLKVAFNDIDFCLKVRESGYKIIFTPFAELYHFESKSRGSDQDPDKIARFHSEVYFMKKKWGKILENDPFFNPNLSLDSEQVDMAFPPRQLNLI